MTDTDKNIYRDGETPPVIICVSGLKNSGKTALIEALIPLLETMGVSVAVIKHHGHGFAGEIPDKPGSDTYRFLANGAMGAVIYDDEMISLVRRGEPRLEELIALFPDADLIIIEGAKAEAYPRVAMLRTGQPLTSDKDTLICAVTDPDYDMNALPSDTPRFNFGDFSDVASFIYECFFRYNTVNELL